MTSRQSRRHPLPPRRGLRGDTGSAGHGTSYPAIQSPRAGSRKATRKPNPEAGWKLGDLLGDDDLKRVDRAERGAHGGRAQAHGHRGDRGEAQLAHQQEKHRDEGNQLLLHLHHDPAQSERHARHRNHQNARVPCSRRTRPFTRRQERAGALHHGEAAPDQKNQRDHRRGIDDSLGDGDDGLEGPDRLRLHAWIGAGNDDIACRWPGPPAARTARPATPRSARPRPARSRPAGPEGGGSRRFSEPAALAG